MASTSRPSFARSRPKRLSGVLVPLFSVRTKRSWGIGDIADLPELAKWLAQEGGQRLVQILPIGALPGNETSPYSAATSFGIDPMYVAVDKLEDVREQDRSALLGPDGDATLDYLRATKSVDYATVRAVKRRVLRAAAERFYAREWGTSSARGKALAAFIDEQREWLDDYAMFKAFKARFGDSWWKSWPAGVRDRDPNVMGDHAEELRLEIFAHKYLQWIAHDQWREARRAVNALGVELMGDLPFIVGIDSADVWGHRGEFMLDATLGVPGDAFSPEGQDWGLPAYDWSAMDSTGLAWVRRRAKAMGRLFDRFRLDHLVGYYRMWVRPHDKEKGAPHFVPGVEAEQIARGEKILAAVIEAAGDVGATIVAEDLGTVPPFVRASMAKMKLPGYKVVCWEKDADVFRDPAGWPEISLATSGTHDTETLATWWESLGFDERRHALGEIPALRAVANDRDVDRFTPRVHDAILEALFGAASDLLLLPIQDLFGWRDRVNKPGVVGSENWSYRLPEAIEDLRARPQIAERMRVAKELVQKHGR